jgi:hypothetical protein
MIFESLAEEEVKKTIARARQEVQIAESEVKQKLRDFYNGYQTSDDYLGDYGFKKKDGKYIVPLVAVNITKKVIDKISLVYKYAPVRSLELEEETDEEGNVVEQEDAYVTWIAANPRFNLALKTAERRKNLHHRVLFRPWYDGKRWKFFIDTEYDAHFLSGDPLHPVAYSYLIKRDVTDTVDVSEDVYVFWSDELYFFFNASGEVWTTQPDGEDFQGVNPFGVIPFIEMLDEEPVDMYAETPGAVTLMQANQAINVALNNVNVALHYQSFDQPYMTGVDEKFAANIQVGPQKAIVLPNDATAGLLGYSPKMQESIEVIKGQLQLISWTYNMTMNLSMEGTPASGFSLIVQNIDLLEARHDDVELATVQEKELYQVLRAQQSFWKPKGEMMLPDAQLRVDFQEVDFPVNQKDEMERWDWRIEKNAATELDLIMSENPDMNREEAIEKWNENKALNKRFGAAEKIREALREEGGVVMPGGEVEE